MSDEIVTESNAAPSAAPAPQPPAPAASAPAPVYTQAQVDAMLAETRTQAHNAGAAATRRALEGRTGTSSPAPQPNPPPAAPSPGLTFADLARFQAFNAAAAEHGIPPAGVEMLLGQWGEARPPDTTAWVREKAAAFGWSKSNTSTPSASSPPATPVAASAPAMPATPTPSGSPPAASAGVYDPKPSQMKPADVNAYVAKHGPKAWMALVRQELAGTRVTPPPRR